MNYSELLKNFSKDLITKIPEIQNLHAILLCGSTAKGFADEYSDVELKFIWQKPSTLDDRKKLFAELEDKEDLYLEYYDDDEYYSAFLFNNIKIDVSQISLDIIENKIDEVFKQSDTTIWSQLLFSALLDSETLRGSISKIKDELANYPEDLSIACIKINLIFEEWSLRNILFQRNDLLALHHVFDSTMLQMMRLLFSLNKVFLRSNSFKWLHYQCDLLKIKPQNIESRLTQILIQPLFPIKIEILHELLKESLEIIDNNTDIDTSGAWTALNYQRAPVSSH